MASPLHRRHEAGAQYACKIRLHYKPAWQSRVTNRRNTPSRRSPTFIDRRMSIRYNHGEKGAGGGDSTEANADGDHFDVDTEIDVPTELMREPVVLVKIPAVNIYDQMEMLHDVGELMDINNEDVFY